MAPVRMSITAPRETPTAIPTESVLEEFVVDAGEVVLGGDVVEEVVDIDVEVEVEVEEVVGVANKSVSVVGNAPAEISGKSYRKHHQLERK
jgi:hypothetical protein